MPRRNVPLKTIALTGATLAALALGGASASAAVTLKNVKGFPTTLRGATSADRVYDVESDLSVFCGKAGAGTPLAAGWTDAGVLVHAIDDQLTSSNPYLRISPRLPMRTATIRPYAICAKGPVKATVKSKPAGAGAVSCGRKLAIGMPLSSTWPYNAERAVESRPVGKHGWRTDAPHSETRAICVAPGVFKQVATVSRTSSFAPGASSAAVGATCAGRRRPIGWGYSAPLMPGNTWHSVESSSKLAVPFVSGSLPTGRRGWKLTFRTPDGRGAAAPAQVALHLTCAVPS